MLSEFEAVEKGVGGQRICGARLDVVYVKCCVFDYLGNGMFNTLGNLRLDDRLAITTVDFENGRTIQMTGRATEVSTGLDLPEPERMVMFHIDDVLVSWAPVGHWDHIEPSRYTPSA